MSVRVRLTRVGNKKNPIWRVVVADQRSPRDGRSIETLGHYNPQTQPSTIVIDRERLDYWIERGAEPTGTVKKLMRAPNTEAAPPPAPPPAPAPVEEATTAAAEEQADAPADVAGAAEPEAAADAEAAPEATGSEPDPEAPAEDAPPAEADADTGSQPDPEAPAPESA